MTGQQQETRSAKDAGDLQVASAYVLGPSVDLLTVEHIRQELLAALERAAGSRATLSVDASHVECLTTPGAQLLVAASRYAAEHGQSFRVSARSTVVDSVFNDLGLTSYLDEWRT